jgi:hypothetical protein
MKPPRPFLLPTAALISLLLCIATIILWSRSTRKLSPAAADSFDIVHDVPNESYIWIISDQGRLAFCRQHGHDWHSPHTAFRILGLEYASSTVGQSYLKDLYLPYWLLTVVTLILPLACTLSWIRRFTTTRRQRAGLCPTCGYDLRATPDRCPECGAIPSQLDNVHQRP